MCIRAFSKSLRSFANGLFRVCWRPIITKSMCEAFLADNMVWATALKRRFALFRFTALPTFLLTVKPRRRDSMLLDSRSINVCLRLCNINPGVTLCWPTDATLRNSERFFKRIIGFLFNWRVTRGHLKKNVRLRGFCDPLPGVWQVYGDHSKLPCAIGSHDDVSVQGCLVEKCASKTFSNKISVFSKTGLNTYTRHAVYVFGA